MHSEHFKRDELERSIYKLLDHDDEINIAERADTGYSILCQKFSPENERESDLFRAACTFTAWIERNPVKGREALNTFVGYVYRALPGDDSLDLEEETEKTHLEIGQWAAAHGNRAPHFKTVKEACEARDQIDRWIAAYNAEQKRQTQREAFNGHPVSHGARAIGQRLVENGRGLK